MVDTRTLARQLDISMDKLPSEGQLRLYLEGYFAGTVLEYGSDYNLGELLEPKTTHYRHHERKGYINAMSLYSLFPKSRRITPEYIIDTSRPADAEMRTLFPQLPKQLNPYSIHFYQQRISKTGKIYGNLERVYRELRAHSKRCLNRSIVETLYTSTRDIRSLIQEVERRRRQYPGSRPYIFCGGSIYEYLLEVEPDSSPFFNNTVICPSDLGDGWASAVITEDQLRIGEEISFQYAISRVPRYWNIATLMTLKLAIELEPYSEEDKVINPVNRYDRFLNLE